MSVGPSNSVILPTLPHPLPKLVSVYSMAAALFGVDGVFPGSSSLFYQQVYYLVPAGLVVEASSPCSYSSPAPLPVQQGRLRTAFPLLLCIIPPKSASCWGLLAENPRSLH